VPHNIIWVGNLALIGLHMFGSQGEVVYMTHISAHLSENAN